MKKRLIKHGLIFVVVFVCGLSSVLILGHHVTEGAHEKQNLVHMCEKLQESQKAFEDIDHFLKEHAAVYDQAMDCQFGRPLDRLKASEGLGQLASTCHLAGMTFKFHPQENRDLQGHSYEATRVEIDLKAVLDQDVYQFWHHLAQTLTGVFVARAFSLKRDGETVLGDLDVVIV